MISKGRNKRGIHWGAKGPIIYTSVTEGDPNLRQPRALGVLDESEVGLTIDHQDDQIVIDIKDYRYKGKTIAIEKWGGELRVLVWADEAGEPPYIITFNETETKEAK